MVASSSPNRRIGCLIALLACSAGSPAHAQGWQWQGTAGVLSDRVAYGISQGGSRPSAVLDVNLRSDDGWLAGAGLASLPSERGRAELSLLAGRTGAWGERGAWQASASVLAPLGAGPLRRPDYLQLGMGYAWNERLQLNLWLAPNQPGPAAGGGRSRGRVVVMEASWHQPIGHRLALDAGVGHVDYGALALARYEYGSLGLSWGHGRVQVFVTWMFSNSAASAAAGPRPRMSVLANF